MSHSSTSPLLHSASTSTLRDAAIVPATHRAYQRNLQSFLTFTRLSLSQLLQLSSTHIDLHLSAYFESEFASSSSYHNACHALYGLIFQKPALKYKLGESRLRLRGWRRLITHRSHPPITWELTVVFALTMAKWGYHAEAVGTLLSFDCYLRVGELTRIRYKDVLLPQDPRVGLAHTAMAVRLAHTKTGPNQSVSISRQAVADTLLTYLQSYPFLAKDFVFPFTPASFRHLITQVAASCGLSHIPYVPHSFRHGGATHDFLQHSTIEQIMFRGRWAAMKSTRRYIQTARALLMMIQLPARLNKSGIILSNNLHNAMKLFMDSVARRRTGRRRVTFHA